MTKKQRALNAVAERVEDFKKLLGVMFVNGRASALMEAEDVVAQMIIDGGTSERLAVLRAVRQRIIEIKTDE